MKTHDWTIKTKKELDDFYHWLLEEDTPCRIRVNKQKLYLFENHIKKLVWLTGLEAVLNLDLDG